MSDVESANQENIYLKTVNCIKHLDEDKLSLHFLANLLRLYKSINQCLCNNKLIEIPETLASKYYLRNKVTGHEISFEQIHRNVEYSA